MKSTPHHPGPWSIVPDRKPGDMARIVAQNDYTIGYVLYTDRNPLVVPEDEANARLIAAAPALWQALRDCVSIERKSASRDHLLKRIAQINKIANEALHSVEEN
jgi:hypothetical protein